MRGGGLIKETPGYREKVVIGKEAGSHLSPSRPVTRNVPGSGACPFPITSQFVLAVSRPQRIETRA